MPGARRWETTLTEIRKNPTGWGRVGSLEDRNGSAGLAVHGLLAAARAELLELKTIRGVTTVLGRDVVTLLALSACQRDARTDVGALACHI